MRKITVIIFFVVVCLVTPQSLAAEYNGGTGERNNPYRIATAAELILLGESPEDYDKYFILTADIDLDPNLPGRKVFDTAVIASGTNTRSGFQGTDFTGVFDGNGHIISHLTIMGESSLGLFGQLGSAADVKDLGIEDANIVGTDYLGSLAAINEGSINTCYSTGMVIGNENIGGLVGSNQGNITKCYSTGAVTGSELVGGLVGVNWRGGNTEITTITASYSTVMVSGDQYVGGLAGGNGGNFPANITTCYSTGTVSGYQFVGGLVGGNSYGLDGGTITNCYSTGMVKGDWRERVGGLVGQNAWLGRITSCLWDMETSSQTASYGGVGMMTAKMQDPNTFIALGWDFLNLSDGPHDIWIEPEGGGYPMLWWQSPSGYVLPVFAGGKGEPNDPYLISTVEQLNAIGHNPRLMESHFKLTDNLDVTDLHFYPIGSPDFPYRGVFDGNGHTISHLVIKGVSHLGLFSVIGDGAEVKDLGLVDVNITGLDDTVGGLVGLNWGRTVTNCFSTGTVTGGDWRVGGLVGYNDNGDITGSYSTGTVTGGDWYVGGLVGYNENGSITNSYSTCTVTGGDWGVGGLVGGSDVNITSSFWDIETSGQATSAGGTGKTTAQMKDIQTFLDAGWDFVGETANGTEDIWWILEGQDYPRLWWETE